MTIRSHDKARFCNYIRLRFDSRGHIPNFTKGELNSITRVAACVNDIIVALLIDKGADNYLDIALQAAQYGNIKVFDIPQISKKFWLLIYCLIY